MLMRSIYCMNISMPFQHALPDLSRKNGKASFPLSATPVRRSFRARLPHLNARTTLAMTAGIT